jgi:hypothetical protein
MPMMAALFPTLSSRPWKANRSQSTGLGNRPGRVKYDLKKKKENLDEILKLSLTLIRAASGERGPTFFF